MNIQQIEQIILGMQNTLPVHEFSYRSRKVWPVIRATIYYGLIHSSRQEKAGRVESATPGKPAAVVVSPWKSRMSLLSVMLNSRRQYKTELKKIRGQADILFLFCKSTYYTETLQGKMYSKYIDPYVETVSKKYSVIKLHIEENETEYLDAGRYTIPAVTLLTPAYLKYKEAFNTLTRRFRKSGDDSGLKTLVEQINAELEKSDASYRLSFYSVKHLLDKSIEYEALYSGLLKKINPRAVAMVAYYEDAFQWGMLSAAAKNKIPVIDIAHGKGDMSYEYWNKTYEFLPGFFWVWSADKYRQVEEKNKTLHPFLGGNMWMAKFKNREVPDSIPGDFKKTLASYERVVLVTIEAFFSHLISGLLEELIASLGKSCFWCVRFHPMMTAEEKSSLSQMLDKYSNVDYKQSTKSHLYDIFQVVNCQVTLLSTTAIEGLMFNVPCMLVHSNGKHAYKEMVEKGILLHSENPDEIRDFIQNGYSIPDISEYNLVQDETAVLSRFGKIINN